VRTEYGIDLNNDWCFVRKKQDRQWLRGSASTGHETIDLPHCWNARDAFQDGVDYYRGFGAYRKQFMIPSGTQKVSGGTWLLESEGFYGTGDVWLNGTKVADVDGEYLGFSLEVSRLLRPGEENVLAVRLTNKCRSHILPGIDSPDFLLYGGLSGRLRLVQRPPVHLVADSLRILCVNALDPQPVVAADIGVMNRSDGTADVRLRWLVVGPDGKQAAAVESGEPLIVPPTGSLTESVQFRISKPFLWDPEEPGLYSLVVEVIEDGAVVDRLRERFGLRHTEFTASGFMLNGRRTELRGMNRHESMPGFGRAMPERLHRMDAALLKDSGCNFVRLSHYPQHPAFLDACDELGIMVYAEIASWKSVRTGRWLQLAMRQIERMICRDRNRPGIIIWGMGNEARSRRAYLALSGLCRQLDPSRPVTYAENHLNRARRNQTTGMVDVWACNYETAVLRECAAASRKGATVVSECCNLPTALRGDAAEEMKQVAMIERELRVISGEQFNAGYLIWCMNDYATLRKKRYRRYSGVFDAWRVPKPACDLLKALQLRTPFVRLVADWREDRNGNEAREVHCFTNCERITLLRNGRELLSVDGEPHLKWSVDFDSGELLVKGSHRLGSAEDRVESWGSAHSIQLTVDPATADADRRETVQVDLEVLDEHRRRCRDWMGQVILDSTGPAILRGYRSDGHTVVAGGIGRSFLVGTGGDGKAVVRAASGTLRESTATISFARIERHPSA